MNGRHSQKECELRDPQSLGQQDGVTLDGFTVSERIRPTTIYLIIGDYTVIRQPGEKFEKFRERIKEEARLIKDHLMGKIVKVAGGRKISGRRRSYRTNLMHRRASHYRKRKEKRKIKNAMAYKSKRINRLRSA